MNPWLVASFIGNLTFPAIIYVVCCADAGEVPLDNSLLRQVLSLLRRLPTIESEKFQDEFLMVCFKDI